MKTISNIKNQKSKIILVFIFLLAFGLRIYGLDWDEGRHFHPDERALIMVADKVHLFDQMNPDFFNYGSFPIYLLRGTAQVLDWIAGKSTFANYDGLLVVGRWLSVIFDIITLVFVYKIAKLFNNKGLPLFAAFFYAVMFFPIQNSHFFVVDVFLTTLTTMLVYVLMNYLKTNIDSSRRLMEINRDLLRLVVLGVLFGAMLATKVSSLVFLPVILLGINSPYIIEIIKKWKLIEIYRDLLRLIAINFTLIFSTFISFALLMPYGLIEWNRFIRDVSAQVTMNSDPYIFPYTLQYVGTMPYLYYLKNMFLWGVGIPISIMAIVGIIATILKLKTKMLKLRDKRHAEFIPISFFLLFYLFYFLVIGRSAVKFMRYMLPLYPFIAILAGYGIFNIQTILRKTIYFRFLIIGYLLLVVGYTAMFVNMYSYQNTRISATEWMLNNLPAGSVLGVEHWDDRVPVYGGERFVYEELGLYELPDDEAKWSMMREKINRVDYIVLASNRLYIPLQKLTDCNKYKKCYPLTAKYYQDLFSGKLGFAKIADFHVYPTIPFSEQLFGKSIGIDDQGADESFTVYDHPRVIVFGRTLN